MEKPYYSAIAMQYTRIRLAGILLAILCIGQGLVAFFGPFGMDGSRKSPMDYLFILLLFIHLIWWVLFFRKKRSLLFRLIFRMPEVLFGVTMVLFLFSYIYASNANMDYVQRFAASSGNLRLAPDSRVERLNSLLRYLPLLLFHMWTIIYFRIKKRRIFTKYTGSASFYHKWGLFLSLVSAALYTLAHPSFVHLDGIPFLAWFGMIPLFIALRKSPRLWAVFYGVLFGVVQTMLCNYWLGTFSLISLQFITIYYCILYIIFMTVLVHLMRDRDIFAVLAMPAAWTAFDFLRSLGFMGYPWGMLGVSQYQFTSLIQLASVTGIWGVSFLVYASNAVLARLILTQTARFKKSSVQLTGALAAVIFAVFLTGRIYLAFHPFSGHEDPGGGTENSAVVALVQQNTDPRKNDYEEGLAALQRLTDRTLPFNPDLIAWSETAFVPNIRRWSKEDPASNYYAGLVKRFLDYQRSLDTWLVTGNDDYFIIAREDGEEVRHDYNASILFSPEGERTATYHKIHLVPFTEYFPFKDQLPWMYDLLINFDVNLWTPGEERTVFRHPLFTFSTPICFEDSFPGDVREFVRAGAEVIINLSNDFWSLTNVEAKQHFVNALFRSVENRRHFLRATASGVTSHTDPQGRTLDTLPYYEEGILITEIDLSNPSTSLYTRFGDWFPYLCIAFVAVLGIYRFIVLRKRPGE